MYGNAAPPYDDNASKLWLSAISVATSPMCSRASHAEGGKFVIPDSAWLGSVLVAIAKYSMLYCALCSLIQDLMSGTSRWQCGHQCARNITTFGFPSAVIVTGVPSKLLPSSVGAWAPFASLTV